MGFNVQIKGSWVISINNEKSQLYKHEQCFLRTLKWPAKEEEKEETKFMRKP